jgi:hypothetical protein
MDGVTNWQKKKRKKKSETKKEIDRNALARILSPIEIGKHTKKNENKRV